MRKIDFEDGQQVKAEVLRLIKEGKRTYSSAGEDKEGAFYEYRWADASIELSIGVRAIRYVALSPPSVGIRDFPPRRNLSREGYSLSLSLTFRFPRPMCPVAVNKNITIPVAGELEPTAPMLEVLTKSIEAYEPAN